MSQLQWLKPIWNAGLAHWLYGFTFAFHPIQLVLSLTWHIHARYVASFPFKPGTWWGIFRIMQNLCGHDALLQLQAIVVAAFFFKIWATGAVMLCDKCIQVITEPKRPMHPKNIAETYNVMWHVGHHGDVNSEHLSTSQAYKIFLPFKKLKATHKNWHGHNDAWSSQLSQCDVGRSQQRSSNCRDQPLRAETERWEKNRKVEQWVQWNQ